jgi:hypothetical protein
VAVGSPPFGTRCGPYEEAAWTDQAPWSWSTDLAARSPGDMTSLVNSARVPWAPTSGKARGSQLGRAPWPGVGPNGEAGGKCSEGG